MDEFMELDVGQESPVGTATKLYTYPAWSGKILNHYWLLRNARNPSHKRRQYRIIEKEKKRLQDAGVDGQLIRLLCRHAVNPGNRRAAYRWWEKLHESYQQSLPFC